MPQRPASTPFRYEIELSGAHDAEDIPTTYTGTDFHGRVKLVFEEALEVRSFLVKLLYRVTGSGSPETHELFQQRFEMAPVREGQEVAKRVLLSVPERAPISYEGAYVKLLWSVTLELELETGEVLIEEHPVLILPRPTHLIPGAEVEEESERISVRLSNADVEEAREEEEASQPDPSTDPKLDIMDPADDIESSDTLAPPEADFVSGVMDLPDDEGALAADVASLGAIAVVPGAMDLPDEGEGASVVEALLADTPMGDVFDQPEEGAWSPVAEEDEEAARISVEFDQPESEAGSDAKTEDEEAARIRVDFDQPESEVEAESGSATKKGDASS